MSSGDKEEQTLEILAIQEICESENVEIFTTGPLEDIQAKENIDFFKSFPAKSDIGGRIKVSPIINESLIVTWSGKSQQQQEFVIHHLPPLTIEFVFPENYPSDVCADFVVKCDWLTEEQLNLISKEFHLTWQDSGGCVVLFTWITFIKEDLLSLLGIDSKLKIPTILFPENPTKTTDIVEKVDAADHDSKEYEGTICKFYQDRGFGFIKCHKLKPTEIFFHISEFKSRGDTNEEDILNKDVIFEKSFNKFRKKVMAINVKIVLKDDEITKSVQEAKNKEDHDIEEEPKLVKLMKSYQEEQELKIFNMQYFDCSICFVEKPGKSCLKFVQCSHVFCKECMTSYFEVQINEGQMSNLTCPQDKCTAKALPTQVKNLVSSKHYQMYEDVLLSTTLETMSDVILCPLLHCQCPTLIDREASMGQCPKCEFAFCIYCKASFHGVAPCRMKSQERRKLITEYMGADDSHKIQMEKRYGKKQLQTMVDMFMSEKYLCENTKPCPKCQAPIQKSEGCNKMTCNKCGTFFCYICGARLPNQNPYSHFSVLGNECYQLLFEGADEFGDEEFIFLDEDDEHFEEDFDLFDQ